MSFLSNLLSEPEKPKPVPPEIPVQQVSENCILVGWKCWDAFNARDEDEGVEERARLAVFNREGGPAVAKAIANLDGRRVVGLMPILSFCMLSYAATYSRVCGTWIILEPKQA